MDHVLISDQANIVVLDNPQQDLQSLVATLTTDYALTTFLDRPTFISYAGQTQRIDLIVIDIDALGDDAHAVFTGLRELPHLVGIPIIITLSLHDAGQEQLALSFNATGYITKPFSIPIELARIKNHIHTHRSLQVSREQNRYFDLKASERSAKLTDIRSELLLKNKDLSSREKDTLLFLSRAADYRDPETGAHLQRMSHYAKLIAKNLGLPEADQELLLEASPLHDIGKLGISDDILLKPGRLSPEEFDIMKQHAVISYEILRGSTSPLMRAAAELALTHHEKYDGSGYPAGLAGEAIPLFGRITAVADVFDALTSVRPYKPAWPLQKAVDFLQEQSGKHFDPLCVEAFLQDWTAVLDIHESYLEG
ncbi:MAG: HD domain-containing protein [Methylovulum sp.]|nr:HD domain-containing protein [Methylovulum sp.]